MRRPFVAGLSLALCAIAAPAFAGNVYIPVVGAVTDGIGYSTEVTVSNTGFEDAQFTSKLLPLDTDGTANEEEGQTILLLSGRTVVLAFGTDENGMLQVDAANGLVFNARAVGESGGEELVGAQLPVVTADNLAAANSVAHLQGWMRDGELTTDFGLMNLGQEALCSISVLRAGGGAILSNVPFPWKPLSGSPPTRLD